MCRATRALHCSGNGSLENALTWIEQHGEDADIDEPMLVPKVPKKHDGIPGISKSPSHIPLHGCKGYKARGNCKVTVVKLK